MKDDSTIGKSRFVSLGRSQQIGFHDMQALGGTGQQQQLGIAQLGNVACRAAHIVAPRQQSRCQMGGDEAGDAGDGHGRFHASVSCCKCNRACVTPMV